MVLKTLKNGQIFGSRTLKMLFMDSEKFGFVHGDYWLPTHCFHLPQNSFICLRVNTRVSSFYRQTAQEEINYFIHMVITVIFSFLTNKQVFALLFISYQKVIWKNSETILEGNKRTNVWNNPISGICGLKKIISMILSFK